MDTPDGLLTRHVRRWVSAFCGAKGWPEPGPAYYSTLAARVPDGLIQLVATGIEEGLIQCDGYTFTLPGQAPGKGPYRWLSNRQWPGGPEGPHPNWEYLVHVAEYVRLSRIAQTRGLRLTFEDGNMDLALYDADTLLVCVEAKATAKKLRELMAGLSKYAPAVDLDAPDRDIDGLRKAKYIVRRRPHYFCGVAPDCRLEYRVEWLSERGFDLVPDAIPNL